MRARAVLGSVTFALGISGAAAQELKDVRFGGDAQSTRVVFDLSAPSDYRLDLLGGRPRLVIDFDRLGFDLDAVAEWDAARNDGVGIGQGLVDRFRFAHFSPETSRVVLDLSGPARVKAHYLLAPNDVYPNHRVVLDLEAAGESAFREALANAMPTRSENVTPAETLRKRVVYIDPGHGGRDPGAIGPAGTREKNVVLALSKALRDTLERDARYEVRLTRERDVLIAHGDRVTQARRGGADIFISIHANALGDRRTSGSAVYTLDTIGYDRAKRQVLRADPREGVGADLSHLDGEDDTRKDVQNALADLLLRETSNRSALLAQEIIGEIVNANRLLRKPHRQENFAVLLAPDVAAVLVESAFISNREDEKRLNSAVWRAQFAESLAAAIDAYFDRAAPSL